MCFSCVASAAHFLFLRGKFKMEMYQKMYYHLFNAVTDALEENDIEKMKKILVKAQQETEEIYISWEEKIK